MSPLFQKISNRTGNVLSFLDQGASATCFFAKPVGIKRLQRSMMLYRTQVAASRIEMAIWNRKGISFGQPPKLFTAQHIAHEPMKYKTTPKHWIGLGHYFVSTEFITKHIMPFPVLRLSITIPVTHFPNSRH